MTPLSIRAVSTLLLVSQHSAFSPIATKYSLAFLTPPHSSSQYLCQYQSVSSLFAVEEDSSASTSISASNSTDNVPSLDEEGGVINAAAPLALPASDNDQLCSQQMTNNTSTSTSTSNSTATATTAITAFMITNEMKRVLIEELGYKRQEVNQIRIELVDQVISKRIPCPPDGMPSTWYEEKEDAEISSQDRMLQKLENEGKYPLKAPLLGVSLVLSGKGFTDAIVTVIKVNMGFQGVSLMEKFMGVPVLAIDFVCVVIGVALGTWTWNTMKD